MNACKVSTIDNTIYLTMLKKYELITNQKIHMDILKMSLSDVLFTTTPDTLDNIILTHKDIYLPKIQNRDFYLDPVFLNHKLATFFNLIIALEEIDELWFIDFDMGDVINNNKLSLIADVLGHSTKLRFKWVKNNEELLSLMVDNVSENDILVSNQGHVIENIIKDPRDLILYVPEWGWTIGYEERIVERKSIRYVSGYEEILDNVKNYDKLTGVSDDTESIVNKLFKTYTDK